MQFWINPEKMNRRVSELDSIKGELGSIASGLEDIISTNAIQMDSYNQIKNVLRSYRQNVQNLSQNTSQMRAGLQDVLEEYKTHEQNIVEKASHTSSKRPGSANNLIPGLSLPWSVLFPSGIWVLPSVTPGWGEIAGGLWNTINKVITNGYNDGSDKGLSWSVLGGKKEWHENFYGTDVKWNGEYHVGHFKTTGSMSGTWDLKNGLKSSDAKGGATGKISFSVVDGKVNRTAENFKETLEASVGNASVEGAVGFSLFSKGLFTPSVYGKVKGKISVAEGSYSGQLGNDDYNVHVKASGTLWGAEAEAGFQAGWILDENESESGAEAGSTARKVTRKWRISGKVGAEAYAAQGSISGGFTLFGVKFNASIEGKVGGAGAKAGGKVEDSAVEGELGAGLGLGLGLKIKVDWTDFKWPW